MAVTTGLVRRELVIPVTVSRNDQVMASFWAQIQPLVFSDAYGSYAWFVNHFSPSNIPQEGATVIWWLMTPANDTQFVTNIMPNLLAQVGLSGIQTYSETVSAGY